MKASVTSFWSLQGSFSFFLLASLPVTAQVAPDKTLPINSVVTPQGSITIIDRGTVKDGNLFHSFEKFSIPTNSTVLFNNAANIQNIFTRVTGNSVSNIDGILKTNGTANLFLLNPNGIIFGQNSRLEVGGSFFASTASAIKFADGSEFNATNPQVQPLLTISVPLGFQVSRNAGKIQVNGTGQGLTSPSIGSSPISRNNSVTDLRVSSGKTLALVGGEINVEGATLTAEQGRIELGSVDFGLVSFSPSAQSSPLNYEGVSSFKDIHLSQQALVDTSGDRGGSIGIQGKHIFISNGSVVLSQNLGSQPWGGIQISASDSLKLSGNSLDRRFVSVIRTESVGSGNGGRIDVSAKQLDIQGGGAISNRNYNVANGGNLTINADLIKLIGASAFNPFAVSSIATTALSSGKAGDIKVRTRRLEAMDGGQITSLSLGAGTAGNITIDAINSIQITNSAEVVNSPGRANSLLSSVAFNQGNAGNLTINTPRLALGDDATVNTSSTGSGIAGIVTINASDIDVKGGSISSAIVAANPARREQLQAPPSPSGEPGEIKINTNRLSLTHGVISVRNQGAGKAGTLTINSRSIFLKDKSSITATTASGQGGNILVNSQDLRLRNNSTITATAGGNGDGGNISINTGILTALESSSITANAVEGQGGNIQINGRGVFLSSDSKITASSEQGINGTVKINAPQTDFNRTATVPSAVVIPEATQRCAAQLGERTEFVDARTGVIPSSPISILNSFYGWRDESAPASVTQSKEIMESTGIGIKSPEKYVEAQGWLSNGDGTVRLTNRSPKVVPYSSWTQTSCRRSQPS
ncbi:filamentous hemagglutinin N-terminal domain-containing protein [Nostoc sp. CHAB 5836]|uniref:two-partner secretion domain-containing protein n=1 Tax=Nostoc sp. CHAB 5836 TaxID=2780404 RepID=UPI001E3B415F|nr:filamentous hemagglutinin N-terminal domain-containing protein [Nostoc sp. CHAB 5836]MCC5613767.1 filamentous hemagglutinin N-terminal domain-containing protein [Nostoc sp. CHAB 5836]